MTTIQIVRKELSSDEVAPSNIRWNEDCNCFQQTVDGGTTWTDDPGADPRINDALRLPAGTGEDQQCTSAGLMTDYVKTCIDNAVSDVGVFAEASILWNLLLIFTGFGIILDVIIWAIEGVITLGIVEVSDAMTDDVYDQLTCIFFCHIGSDGSVTQMQYDAIVADVSANIGGIGALAINYFLNVLGAVGLSNWGATGTTERTCDSCDCSTCYTWLFTESDGGWIPYLDRGDWVDGEGWNAVAQGSGGYIEVVYTFPSPIHLTNFAVTYGENCAFNPIGSGTWIAYVDGTGEHIIGGLSNDCGSPLNINRGVGADDVTAIAFRMEQNSPTGFAGTTLIQATITGVWDDEPTGGMTC